MRPHFEFFQGPSTVNSTLGFTFIKLGLGTEGRPDLHVLASRDPFRERGCPLDTDKRILNRPRLAVTT
jgi:hypothetical protein